MGLYFIDEGDLVPINLGVVFDNPTRSEFLVSDSELLNSEFVIDYATIDGTNSMSIDLVLISKLNNKYYYSLPNKFIKSLNLKETYTSEQCCENSDTKLTITDGQSNDPAQFSVSASADGVLCSFETASADFVSYSVSFISDNFESGGMSVTSIGSADGTSLTFVTENGTCYSYLGTTPSVCKCI